MEQPTSIHVFFRDMFEYHHHFNQVVADVLIAHVADLSGPSIPMFSHLINAHQVWNARILNGQPLGVHDVHSLEKCKALDDMNYQDTLSILDRFDPGQTIGYRNSGGTEFHNTVREILFHVGNHSTHHRAQIISDLRRQGIAPPVTDYIFYKR